MTQNNLGCALHDQAGQSSGAEAVRLSANSAMAYRAALLVYSPIAFPQLYAMVSTNLALTEQAIQQIQK